MKFFLISTAILVSSISVAQNSTPSSEDKKLPAAESVRETNPEQIPKSENSPNLSPADGQGKVIQDEAQGKTDTKKSNSKTSDADKSEAKNQEVSQDGKETTSDEPTHSPYGASYSFGMARFNEGSVNLNSSGFARVEVHRKMSQKLLNFERLEMGLNYSGADIGGNMGKNGAFNGAVNFYGGRFSAYTKPQSRWFYQYSAGFDIAKIKKIPAFNFISGKTTVSYAPVLSIGGAAHYYLVKGLAIGPRLDLALGGVTGWNFGFQARLAY